MQYKVPLPTLKLYPSSLKASHNTLKDDLSQTIPGSNQSPFRRQTQEIALKNPEDYLGSRSPPDGGESRPREGTTAFLCGRTAPAERQHGTSGRCLTSLPSASPIPLHWRTHFR